MTRNCRRIVRKLLVVVFEERFSKKIFLLCFIVLDLASSSHLDYVGDVAILVSVGLLFYGIYKVSFFFGEPISDPF